MRATEKHKISCWQPTQYSKSQIGAERIMGEGGTKRMLSLFYRAILSIDFSVFIAEKASLFAQ